MTLGIYGGTFDPVHHGHLILARDARERLGLDEVWFVPCAQSPHKDQAPGADGEARLTLLRAAVEGEPGLFVSDVEVRRRSPSYAIDTVLHFRSERPGADLVWLIGTDQLAKLDTWHRFPELQQLVRFETFTRRATGPGGVDRTLDLSATEIRERVRAGKSIRYLTPDPVVACIDRLHLYS